MLSVILFKQASPAHFDRLAMMLGASLAFLIYILKG